MALKVGEGLTAGSSRLTITIKKGKCGNTVVHATNRCHISQWGGGGAGRDGRQASFALPEFKSKIA